MGATLYPCAFLSRINNCVSLVTYLPAPSIKVPSAEPIGVGSNLFLYGILYLSINSGAQTYTSAPESIKTQTGIFSNSGLEFIFKKQLTNTLLPLPVFQIILFFLTCFLLLQGNIILYHDSSST